MVSTEAVDAVDTADAAVSRATAVAGAAVMVGGWRLASERRSSQALALRTKAASRLRWRQLGLEFEQVAMYCRRSFQLPLLPLLLLLALPLAQRLHRRCNSLLVVGCVDSSMLA